MSIVLFLFLFHPPYILVLVKGVGNGWLTLGERVSMSYFVCKHTPSNGIMMNRWISWSLFPFCFYTKCNWFRSATAQRGNNDDPPRIKPIQVHDDGWWWHQLHDISSVCLHQAAGGDTQLFVELAAFSWLSVSLFLFILTWCNNTSRSQLQRI